VVQLEANIRIANLKETLAAKAQEHDTRQKN
jgi:hypothetical protein